LQHGHDIRHVVIMRGARVKLLLLRHQIIALFAKDGQNNGVTVVVVDPPSSQIKKSKDPLDEDEMTIHKQKTDDYIAIARRWPIVLQHGLFRTPRVVQDASSSDAAKLWTSTLFVSTPHSLSSTM
jgi:hypothetical protein